MSNYSGPRAVGQALLAPCARAARRCSSACRPCGNWRAVPKSTSRAWCCPARCSRSWASTTSARSTATTCDALVHDAAATCASSTGPQFLHVVTRKGKGYAPAEATRSRYHGPGPVRPGQRARSSRKQRSRPDLHPGVRRLAVRHGRAGRAPRRHHAGDARGLGPGASSSERFPERYFDVGIAEQHAVTFAAGLACEGMKPVVAIYSTFLQRAYDQLIHDVALQNLPVLFAIDRAGLVGADGPTHDGAFDLQLPALPAEHGGDGAGGRERVPADALHRRHGSTSPAAVRYPRGTRPGRRRSQQTMTRAAGRQGRAAAQRRSGVALLAFGTMLAPAADRRRSARRHRGQHALRQAAGRRRCWRIWRAATRRSSRWRRTSSPAAPAARSTNAWPAARQQDPGAADLGLPDRFIEHGRARTMLARPAWMLDARRRVRPGGRPAASAPPGDADRRRLAPPPSLQWTTPARAHHVRESTAAHDSRNERRSGSGRRT